MGNTVDMTVFLKNKARILSDRSEGIRAREKAGLDNSDQIGEKVILQIPRDDMWNITPSFFGGMFEPSIIKYKEHFWDYYCFRYKNDKIGSGIDPDLQDKMDYNYKYILERID